MALADQWIGGEVAQGQHVAGRELQRVGGAARVHRRLAWTTWKSWYNRMPSWTAVPVSCSGSSGSSHRWRHGSESSRSCSMAVAGSPKVDGW
jgi:hypothetical protein